MRTIRKAYAILLLMTCMFLAFPAVLRASDTDAPGRYDAVSCEQDGNGYECDGEYLLLNENGEGEIQFNGVVYPLKWQLDGSTLTITDENDDSEEGILEDGAIYIRYYGYDYVFNKSDGSLSGSIDEAQAAGDEADAAAEAGDSEKDQIVGEDPLQSVSTAIPSVQEGPAVYAATDREGTGNSGSAGRRKEYIALNEDGTGIFLSVDEAFTIRWKQEQEVFSFTDHQGNPFTGTMEGGRITGTYGGYRYTFSQTGETLPCYRLSPDSWGEGLPAVVDEAGVLSDPDERELTQKAEELSDQYDVGVYMFFVRSRDDYTWTGDISLLSAELRSGYALGIDQTEKKEKHEKEPNPDWKDAVFLTIAVSERKYDIGVSGEYGNWAFPAGAREMIRDHFLDDLREDRWAGAAGHYLDGVEDVLRVAAKGKQYSFRTSSTGRLIGFLAPAVLALLFGYGIAAVKRSSMQNTQKAQNAAEYVAGNKVNFTRREDRYIRTLVSRTYSPKQKSSGGGGGSFTSSGGTSHTSGSF